MSFKPYYKWITFNTIMELKIRTKTFIVNEF